MSGAYLGNWYPANEDGETTQTAEPVDDPPYNNGFITCSPQDISRLQWGAKTVVCHAYVEAEFFGDGVNSVIITHDGDVLLIERTEDTVDELIASMASDNVLLGGVVVNLEVPIAGSHHYAVADTTDTATNYRFTFTVALGHDIGGDPFVVEWSNGLRSSVYVRGDSSFHADVPDVSPGATANFIAITEEFAVDNGYETVGSLMVINSDTDNPVAIAGIVYRTIPGDSGVKIRVCNFTFTITENLTPP